MNNPEYTQGICEDGAAILRDGKPMTIEEILDSLRGRDQLQAEVERLQAQLNAAKRGMDSAKDAGAKMMAIGKKLAAENSPEVIESEREANAVMTAENERLQDEVERLRLQLAACGVVALANTPESAARQRDMHPDYMSASCQDVIAAVDREIALRGERDQLKAALQRFMELDQNDRDLPLELWAVQRDVSPVDVSLAQHDAEVIEREAKPIATEFFRWWYNQPGSNTDQGFDEWWQLRKGVKEVQS